MNKFSRWIKDTVTEWFFLNPASAMHYRNMLGFLLGFVASLLLLTSWTDAGGKPVSEATAAWTFVALLGFVLLLLILVRPNRESAFDQFAWGVLVIMVLGFGAGALVFHYRDSLAWPWNQQLQFLRDAEKRTARVILESLFLLGVILGFFVVRNWAKEQKDFVASLTAVLGGTFVASLVGKLDGGPPLADSFAAYALGFTLSGTVNLIVAARLTAIYTNRKTIASRAILDFLYGSERAKTIDNYFLKNFEEDPNYAKAWLINALIEFAGFTKKRFAERMERRRVRRGKKDLDRREQIKASLERTKQKLSDAKGRLETAADADKQGLETEVENLKKRRQELEEATSQEKCYQLLTIRSEEKKANEPPPASEDDRQYTIIYREIDKSGIKADMFRIGVSVRWQDTLEYIVAPGEYKGAFPFMGSVAGLALLVRKTIVMDRDRFYKFRSKDFPLGIAPAEIEQKRGLDEIDFLSYISTPVVSRLSQSTENAVGILNVDTKIFFATDKELGKDKPGAEAELENESGTYSAKLTLKQLTGFARRLYEPDGKDINYDQDIKYLEEITRIIVPLLELYLKCRQGAT